MASVDLSFATVCGHTDLGLSAVLSLRNVAWLDVCPVIWVALMDSSHGRFWIVPGFGSSLNVDLRWFWVFTDFGSPLDLSRHWIWVSTGFGLPLDLGLR